MMLILALPKQKNKKNIVFEPVKMFEKCLRCTSFPPSRDKDETESCVNNKLAGFGGSISGSKPTLSLPLISVLYFQSVYSKLSVHLNEKNVKYKSTN